ncbi:MAG: cardiolipin synthase ClsB [Pseudomonadota bacterium]
MATGKFRSGNAITLLESGTEYFPALEAAILNAQREVYLETYIFADDETGRRIADALIKAVVRGVHVGVVVDGFGSRLIAKTLVHEMRSRGVKIFVFRPEVTGLRFHRHRLRRLHRKIAVIDSAVAFVGGINIINDVQIPEQISPRYDYTVRIEGPLLSDIYPAATQLWRHLYWLTFHGSFLPPRSLPIIRTAGSTAAAFLIRDNVRHRRDIEQAYLRAIASAQNEIVIANAYFLPGKRFRRALTDAAARGVRVVLLLQGRVEYFWMHYATRALYGSLLAGGVEIMEYHKSFLHAKVAVIDLEWATVGSSNIDPFSLMLAREANVVIRDQAFARQLRDSLEKAMVEGATPVQGGSERRSMTERMLAWTCYELGRFVMGLFGYEQD